jgi:hypothetical protein
MRKLMPVKALALVLFIACSLTLLLVLVEVDGRDSAKESIEGAMVPAPEPPLPPDTATAETESTATGQVTAAIRPQSGPNNQANRLETDRRRANSTSPLIDSRYETEPIDPVWAPQMAARFQEIVPALDMHLLDVRPPECRTTVCRMTVTHDDNVTALDDNGRAEIFVPEGKKFRDAMRLVIESSNGRLMESGVISRAPRLSGERWESTFYVSGPRLAE